MTKSEVINHFQGVTKAAAALNRTKGAISQWPEDLPFETQCYVEVMTNGVLKAESKDETAA